MKSIQLMLTQAILDKLWIMDAEGRRCRADDAFHELLTTEARISKEALSAKSAAAGYQRRVGNLDEDGAEGKTDQVGWSAVAGMALVARLWIERPRACLADLGRWMR